MRRIAWLVLVAAAGVGPAPILAQGPPGGENREALEQQVRGRFLGMVADRAGLTDTQREQVWEVLQSGVEERRELARQSRELRRDLMQAIREDDTPMATYESLLERLEAVREREGQLERREQERLEGILDPRQRALFLALRMQFNDRVRRLQGMDRPGRRGGGPPD